MEPININHQIQLTDNFQRKSADRLISKLQIELGKEKTYSLELEESIKQFRVEIEDLKRALEKEQAKVKKVLDKYSSDVQQAVKLDSVYQKQNETIKNQEIEINSLKSRCDKYVTELVKIRGERNN